MTLETEEKGKDKQAEQSHAFKNLGELEEEKNYFLKFGGTTAYCFTAFLNKRWANQPDNISSLLALPAPSAGDGVDPWRWFSDWCSIIVQWTDPVRP